MVDHDKQESVHKSYTSSFSKMEVHLNFNKTKKNRMISVNELTEILALITSTYIEEGYANNTAGIMSVKLLPAASQRDVTHLYELTMSRLGKSRNIPCYHSERRAKLEPVQYNSKILPNLG